MYMRKDEFFPPLDGEMVKESSNHLHHWSSGFLLAPVPTWTGTKRTGPLWEVIFGGEGGGTSCEWIKEGKICGGCSSSN